MSGAEICRACGAEVLVMAARGTGTCGQACARQKPSMLAAKGSADLAYAEGGLDDPAVVAADEALDRQPVRAEPECAVPDDGPLLRSHDWERLDSVRVVDPDGWRSDPDRPGLTLGWNDMMPRSEWLRRLGRSTQQPYDWDLDQPIREPRP